MSLVAIFGSVGGIGILLLIAFISAFIIICRRRQRGIGKFDLRDGAKNPKIEVIEMLEEGTGPDEEPNFNNAIPFSLEQVAGLNDEPNFSSAIPFSLEEVAGLNEKPNFNVGNPNFNSGNPFSTKLALNDGAGGLDNVYALKNVLGDEAKES